MNLVSSAGSRFSNSALVQRSRTSPPLSLPTRSSGTSRLGPCRTPVSTTRWVSALATGLTTTRLTLPTGPSLALTSVPIVNLAVSAITVLFLSSSDMGAALPVVTLRSPNVYQQGGRPPTGPTANRGLCRRRRRQAEATDGRRQASDGVNNFNGPGG